MADQRRVGGTIQVKVGGVVQSAKGEFTYNLGHKKRNPVLGVDRVHGYTEEVQVPRIEGVLTDSGTLDLKALVTGEDLMITLDLANGKTIALSDAWFAGEGDVTTGEGEIAVLWHGLDCEEV